MTGFYKNAFKVGIGLIANMGKFNGWRSRWVFLYSTLRHFLYLVCKLPLKARTLELRFSGLHIQFKEFTGELGNINTVFFDEDEEIPIPPNALVLDVGANIGLYSLYLVWKYGRDRFLRIFLFEPNPGTFERLKHNLKANGLESLCTAEALALSDRAGMVYMDAPMGYSVLGTISDKGTIPIECKTLDAWRRENAVEHIDLLKVDVEGHEMTLLRGAAETLKKSHYLYIEMKREHLGEFAQVAQGAGFVSLARQDLPTGDSMLLLERRSDSVS